MDHAKWKSIKTRVWKWCQKLCAFLFEVTWAFGKMCFCCCFTMKNLTENVVVSGETCIGWLSCSPRSSTEITWAVALPCCIHSFCALTGVPCEKCFGSSFWRADILLLSWRGATSQSVLRPRSASSEVPSTRPSASGLLPPASWQDVKVRPCRRCGEAGKLSLRPLNRQQVRPLIQFFFPFL